MPMFKDKFAEVLVADVQSLMGIWEIKKVAKQSKSGNLRLRVEKFSLKVHDEWIISVCKSESNFLMAGLHVVNNGRSEVKLAHLDVHIVADDTKCYEASFDSYSIYQTDQESVGNFASLGLSIDDLSSVVRDDDTLVIGYQINVILGNVRKKDETDSLVCAMRTCWSACRSTPRIEAFHSDFTVVVRGRQFNAHKLILAARSTVFRAMLEPGTKESQENKVVIDLFEPDVIEDIKAYMYTEKSPNIDLHAEQLLEAADYFSLHQLTKLCEVILIDNISVENSVELLELGIKHSAKALKTRALKFVAENLLSVKQTEGWKKTSKETVEEVLSWVTSTSSAQ